MKIKDVKQKMIVITAKMLKLFLLGFVIFSLSVIVLYSSAPMRGISRISLEQIPGMEEKFIRLLETRSDSNKFDLKHYYIRQPIQNELEVSCLHTEIKCERAEPYSFAGDILEWAESMHLTIHRSVEENQSIFIDLGLPEQVFLKVIINW